MKSETSFRVFFLKQHRKNSLKNIVFPSVYFWISAFDHRAIVVPKMHIVHWDNPTAFCPERFLEKNESGAWQLLKKERFVPYGFGRRVCLGESLAKDTLRIFFATLVKHLRYNWIHFVSTVPYIDSSKVDQLQRNTFRFSNPVSHPAPDPGNFTETSTVIPDAFHVNIELVRHV